MSTLSLSVVVATDTYATIHPVVKRLRRQTVADQLEILLVTSAPRSVADEMPELPEFGAVRVVEVGSIEPLGAARVAGIQAATAPLVAIGETHAFPNAEWAEAVIAAHRGTWGVVVPAFRNANPDSALSWAGFLADYGAWIEDLPAREIHAAPFYNAVYRRSVLLEFGDRLEHALSHGDEMLLGLRSRGHRMYFEPAARLDHVNASQPFAWAHERYLSGILVASTRAARWSWARRLVYACGAPLIPFVYMSRTMPGVRAARDRLPAGTVPAMFLGGTVKAVGELIGYAIGAGASAEHRMTEYEVHKLAYVAGRTR